MLDAPTDRQTPPLGSHLPALQLVPGTQVDRYEVEALVGEGGMASVYRVRHRWLGSCHALKVVRSEQGIPPERLWLEGRVQASLRHPNVVAVTDLLVHEGTLGLVLDYVGGPTLRQWLRTADDVSGATWLGLFRGILRGVRCAHLAGVVHRDLKPANVLIDRTPDGVVPRVTDFGIAKWAPEVHDASVPAVDPSWVVGTPGFMAPEQRHDPTSVDRRADVFSLGCVLHTLIAGVGPFDRPGEGGVRGPVGDERSPVPLADRVPAIPAPIAHLAEAMLARDPGDRPRSCQDVLEALDDIREASLPDRERPPPHPMAQVTAPGATFGER